MRPLLPLLLALVLAALPARAQVTLSLACSGLGVEFTLCRDGAEDWARRSGNRVRLVSVPSSGTERLALIQQLLAMRSQDLDVVQVDSVWPGILAAHLHELTAEEAHLPAVLAAYRVEGRLVALPWFAGAGLLYYRRDLLERHGRPVPGTWAELEETARHVMQAEPGRMWGHVFQARAYEGLVVNALEWLASHGAGHVVEPDGRISVNNPRAVRALAMAAGWIGTIAPTGVLNYAEEEARAVFQSGQAVFMRNWPYAWALLEAPDSPLRGKVGIAPLPRTEQGPHAAGLGGEGLAVSRHSRHPAQAADLVRHLTSAAEQRRRALAGGFPPTIAALYRDAALLAAQPVLAPLEAALAEGVARPAAVTGLRYGRVSAEVSAAIHAALSGRSTPEAALARLEQRLVRTSRGGEW